MRQRLLSLVRDNHPAVARHLLGPLTEVLRLSRLHCGGDVEKALILLSVAIRTAEHPDFAGYSEDQLLSGGPAVFPSLGANSSSIAASLGMPKETVRRKVNDLVEADWLVRDRQNLCFTAVAYAHLAPVRDAINRLAVRNFEVVSRLLEEHQARP